MNILHCLDRYNESTRIRRDIWELSDYLKPIKFDLSLNQTILIDRNEDTYILSIEDLQADDWEIYSNIGYVAVHLPNNGVPALHIISEEQYSNEQWPKFNYISGWIRFEGY